MHQFRHDEVRVPESVGLLLPLAGGLAGAGKNHLAIPGRELRLERRGAGRECQCPRAQDGIEGAADVVRIVLAVLDRAVLEHDFAGLLDLELRALDVIGEVAFDEGRQSRVITRPRSRDHGWRRGQPRSKTLEQVDARRVIRGAVSPGAAHRMFERRCHGAEQRADDCIEASGFVYKAEVAGDAPCAIADRVQCIGAAN